jgi:hypothetical protein
MDEYIDHCRERQGLMNPLFLLGRALEFPNRELFSSYNGK